MATDSHPAMCLVRSLRAIPVWLPLLAAGSRTLWAQVPPAPLAAPAPRATPALDTTFAVDADARLRVEASAGRIDIHTWDRNAVRVVATLPRPGVTISIDGTRASVAVWARAARGGVDEVEYELTVPRRAALSLGSGDVDITVTGAEGEVVAKNYAGKITVSGGRGLVSLKSTLGEVSVSNARGRISAQSLNAPVRVTDVSGNITVESSSSHLYLTRVDAASVEATTTGGVIQFSGPIHDDGHYTFTTHMGSIILTLPDAPNATVSVATVQGTFASEFPHTIREQRRRGIFTTVIGRGTATLDLESFAGGIMLRHGTTTEGGAGKNPE